MDFLRELLTESWYLGMSLNVIASIASILIGVRQDAYFYVETNARTNHQ